jgi:autotransporter-associated beta strand protein
MKKLFLLALLGLMSVGAAAQRFTDKLDRGLVAIPQGDKTGQDKNYGPSGSGIFVTWRILPSEYYDTKYNLYRNGTKIASDLTKSNYQDNSGTATSKYQVEAVVNGVAQAKSAEVIPWAHQFLDISMQPVKNRSDNDVTSGYSLNDCSVADVDGDGQLEIVVKRRNDSGNLNTSGNKTDFNLHECYKMDGTRLWWIDMGPNLMSGPDEQFDLILYDWDRDGKAEAVMRGADNMIIHTKSGKAIKIGNMNYYAPRDEYTHEGAEYLLYLNGETGEPYGWDGASDVFTPMAYPLPRFESGETNYASVWGKADTGHRSCKHYFGAPYLDGRNPSIFLGRGCYTRHKFCALDVNSTTHELTQRWRWNCYDSSSSWFGNGFHNFAIGDVDMDGRDEIIFGSMMIDDTGYGLSTTGYGHGDAQHCTDLDPYRWGMEQFVCLESTAVPGVAYTNAMSSQLYYTSGTGGDNGRAMAGNFQNTYPGSVARSPGSGLLSCVSDKIIEGAGQMSSDDFWNMRIYWDGDLLDEFMDSPGVERAPCVYKFGGQQEVGTGRAAYTYDRVFLGGGMLNNSSKNNPCFLGDILGDWREEIMVRADNSTLRIYTTSYESPWGLTSLWYDHVYRNGMCWQTVGYNQPPQTSFFVGELEGITNCPPALTLEGRTEVTGTIQTTADHLLISGYEDKTISVADGASPYILTVNTPAWVKGSGGTVQSDGSIKATASTPKQPARTVETFTTTLTGGAFSGATRLVKQGEGILVLPTVTEKHTGHTDVWNGTLQFDGTMETSPVWLNRHTALISDGGNFKGGITADYNATIYIGKDKTGTLTASTLGLGFGARVVFELGDELNVTTLNLETKEWGEYGPKYKSPVFQFNVSTAPAPGKYKLGTVGTLTGSLEEVVIEGIRDVHYALSYENGALYLNISEPRAAADVVWNGTAANSVWDLGVTKNFLKDGVADVSSYDDNIVFNDDAASTAVRIRGAIYPKTITFNNETKNYTLTGDSILGGATITKNGAGKVTINTENRTGVTYINGGTLEVNRLANKSGTAYGALGNASQAINMADGSKFIANGTIITDQPFNVNGSVTIETPAGKNVIFNNAIKGKGATVSKTGNGNLQLGMNNTFTKLVIKQGSVESQKSNSLMQVPDTIELQGGTFSDFPNESSGFTNKAHLVVPTGKTGTFYGAPSCNYTGSLTGGGTLNVYGCGARCYYQGDWSLFEGTLKVGMQDRTVKGTTVSFDFQNAKGLPKATLDLSQKFGSDPVTFTTSKQIEIGAVTGAGTLAGTGFILGTSGKNFTAQFSSTAPITKRGAGYMIVNNPGKLTGALTIEEGAVYFNDDLRDKQFFGNTTVKGDGTLQGYGLLPNLTLEAGGTAVLKDYLLDFTGTLQVLTSGTMKSGSTVVVAIDGAASNSLLQVKFLTLNGTVKVELVDYTPKKGDKFTIWKGTGSISGTPTLDLPALPAGLYWDTSELVAVDGKALKTGVLKVTDDSSVGIDMASGAVTDCDVYTLGGLLVTSFRATPGEMKAVAGSLPLLPGTYLLRAKNRPAVKVMVK